MAVLHCDGDCLPVLSSARCGSSRVFSPLHAIAPLLTCHLGPFRIPYVAEDLLLFWFGKEYPAFTGSKRPVNFACNALPPENLRLKFSTTGLQLDAATGSIRA